MPRNDTVKSSAQGKINLKNARKKAGLSQEKLAEIIETIGVDTIKRLEGTKDRDKNPAVERWAVENIAKALNIKPTDIVSPEDWFGKLYPDEFKSLIEEKTRIFCGRKLVFEIFDKFSKENSKGYFTVVGDAGMGKSSIAAKYVLDNGAICHFNVMAEGRNQGSKFLESVRQQFIERYGLEKAGKDDLAALLTKIRQKLGRDEPIIIVVDALDEVEEERPTQNILNLPKYLEERVYFFLTRRSYSPGQKRLVIEVPYGELNLSDEADAEIKKMNRDDIKAYIRFFLEEEPEHKERLQEWIKVRQIALSNFVEELTQKSEYNFMYLRYVLPAIAKGDYRDFSIKELPEGLQQYYEQHWQRMEMEGKNRENAVLLAVLAKAAKAISCEFIAGVIGRDENDVLDVLGEWRGFLKTTSRETEECYLIYHQSFADFLQQKPAIKKATKLLSDNNDRFWEQLEEDEGEEDEGEEDEGEEDEREEDEE